MSISSFPQAEHVALLRSAIDERLRDRGLSLEVTERGLNQLKCQYRFGFRPRLPAAGRPASPIYSAGRTSSDWKELAIHFQTAQRLEEGCGGEELDRLLEGFLIRNFPGSR